jgi:hypothetical protein
LYTNDLYITERLIKTINILLESMAINVTEYIYSDKDISVTIILL